MPEFRKSKSFERSQVSISSKKTIDFFDLNISKFLLLGSSNKSHWIIELEGKKIKSEAKTKWSYDYLRRHGYVLLWGIYPILYIHPLSLTFKHHIFLILGVPISKGWYSKKGHIFKASLIKRNRFIGNSASPFDSLYHCVSILEH